MAFGKTGIAICTALLSSALMMGCSGNASSQESTTNDAAQEAQSTQEEASSAEQTEAVTGGWAVSDVVNDVLTTEQKELFSKADKDEKLTPSAVLATQVVAGTNHAYLCWDGEQWSVAVVYEDLEGAASLTSNKAIDVSDVATTKESAEGISGGWQAQVAVPDLVLEPEEAFEALAKATADNDEAVYPIALLGTQVVAGTNYKFLCGTTSEEGTSKVYVAEVYQDLDGNVSLTSMDPFDVTAYVG